MMRSTYPSLFQNFDAQRRHEDLCNEGKDKSVHTSMYPTLCLDVSLHGGIPPGRPPDWKKAKVFSQLYVAATYLSKEGTLRGATTSLRTIDGELSNFLKLTLLTSIHLFVLERRDSEICIDMSMVLEGHSIALEQQKILQYMMKIYEYNKKVFPSLYTREKLWEFWRRRTF